MPGSRDHLPRTAEPPLQPGHTAGTCHGRRVNTQPSAARTAMHGLPLADTSMYPTTPDLAIAQDDGLHRHASQEGSRFEGQQVVAIGGCACMRSRAKSELVPHGEPCQVGMLSHVAPPTGPECKGCCGTHHLERAGWAVHLGVCWLSSAACAPSPAVPHPAWTPPRASAHKVEC